MAENADILGRAYAAPLPDGDQAELHRFPGLGFDLADFAAAAPGLVFYVGDGRGRVRLFGRDAHALIGIGEGILTLLMWRFVDRRGWFAQP